MWNHFLGKKHIKFYLYKSGIEKELNISGEINPSSLARMKPEEDNLTCLFLAALALSWGNPFILTPDSPPIGEIENRIGSIKELTQIDNYSSFREFLKAIDFAGRFYEPEGDYKVKVPLKEIMKSAKFREAKN